MAGYTRQDTANNIANGNVIDADDLDSEFNAVEDAFQASSGHNHDGSAGEGAPITKVGPSQDIIVGTTTVLPKANNIIDLGSSAAQYKDGYFDGTVYTDTANIGVNGYTTIEDNEYAVSTGSLNFDVAGDITLDADGGDIMLQDGGTDFGKLTNRSNQLSIYSGTVESLRLNGADVDALGTLDVTGNTTVGGTLGVTGNTSISAGNLTVNTGNVSIGGTLGVTGTITGSLSGGVTGNVTGDLTGNVTGNVVGNVTGDLTGNADTATTLETARTISLTGDVSGSTNFDGSGNVSITAVIADDSHNHVVGNIDGLSEYIADTVGAMVNGNTESGISVTYDDTDNTLDFNVGDPTITLTGAVTGSATMTNLGSVSIATTATADPTLTLTGDASGSATFTNLGNASLSVTIADDSHNHVISNVDGLQTALNGKAALAGSSSQAFSASTLNANTVDLGDWTVTESGGTLYFATGGINKMKLDASGNLTVTGNVTAYGTV